MLDTKCMTQEAITLDDILAAAERLSGVSIVTPMLENAFVNKLVGKRVLIKAENLQRTGSFKFRGGWSAISHLTPAIRQRGVLAYSSGNHAQAIALSAQITETAATIIMPSDAPKLKIDNTRGYGAEVILYDRPAGEQREKIGQQLSEERGLTLIKPYDHPQVMAGQGTVGLEIAEQALALGVEHAEVLVCCGGGGLTSGVALALAHLAPALRVRPVEPDLGDDVKRSLLSGKREANDGTPASICDAIVTPSPGELTFPIMKRLCGAGLSVSDDEALHAMALAMMQFKLVTEPGGVVSLAAAINRSSEIDSDTVICVVSGGNADPQTLINALSH